MSDERTPDPKTDLDDERAEVLPERQAMSLLTGGGLAGGGLLGGLASTSDAGGLTDPSGGALGGGTSDGAAGPGGGLVDTIRDVAESDADSSGSPTVSNENVDQSMNNSDSASSQT